MGASAPLGNRKLQHGNGKFRFVYGTKLNISNLKISRASTPLGSRETPLGNWQNLARLREKIKQSGEFPVPRLSSATGNFRSATENFRSVTGISRVKRGRDNTGNPFLRLQQ